MRKYLETLITEKGRDLEDILEVEGPSGTNYMPLAVLVEAIDHAPTREQQAIRKQLVYIDFHNGDVFDYFRHIAQAIAA